MKRIALFFCFIFSFAAHANNIIVNGTRFIYPGNEKEITVQLSNNADRPALAQAWLDNGDADATPDTITTPFIITPPISRVDAKSGQTLRIKLGSSAGLAKDKETLWWLNLLRQRQRPCYPPSQARQRQMPVNRLPQRSHRQPTGQRASLQWRKNQRKIGLKRLRIKRQQLWIQKQKCKRQC